MPTEDYPPSNNKKIVLVISREEDMWAVTAYMGDPKAGSSVFGYAKRKDREEVLMLAVRMVLDAYPSADIDLCGDLPNEVTYEW